MTWWLEIAVLSVYTSGILIGVVAVFATLQNNAPISTILAMVVLLYCLVQVLRRV